MCIRDRPYIVLRHRPTHRANTPTESIFGRLRSSEDNQIFKIVRLRNVGFGTRIPKNRPRRGSGRSVGAVYGQSPVRLIPARPRPSPLKPLVPSSELTAAAEFFLPGGSRHLRARQKGATPDADTRTCLQFGLGSQRFTLINNCLLYTSPSPRDATLSRMPSSA